MGFQCAMVYVDMLIKMLHFFWGKQLEIAIIRS